MKKLNIFVLFCLFSSILIADTIPIPTVKRSYYYIGGDRISLGVKIFHLYDWKKASIKKKVINTRKTNYSWDDKWYNIELSDSNNDVLVLFWKNHDNNKIGWVAIKNTPDAWFYKKDYSKQWKRIGDGKKIVTFWEVFGRKDTGNKSTGSLSIDIRNPKGRGDIIQVGFGF